MTPKEVHDLKLPIYKAQAEINDKNGIKLTQDDFSYTRGYKDRFEVLYICPVSSYGFSKHFDSQDKLIYNTILMYQPKQEDLRKLRDLCIEEFCMGRYLNTRKYND